MRGSVLLLGVFAVTTCLATSVFAQSGEVTGGDITCGDTPYDVDWSGTWTGLWSYQTVRGFCVPDYSFGSLPEVSDDDVGSGSASLYLPPVYVFEGEDYHLAGAYVWFEWGYWAGGAWHSEGCTSWYYITREESCFPAGTPVLTRDGSKPIEQLTAGDCVLSSPAHDPTARPATNRVKEVTRNRAQVVDITVGGHTVQATREHPFYVKGKDWTPAASLRAGDLLRSHDDRWLPVDSIVDGGECPVYNLRTEKGSAFFIGKDDWGFSLWVHGACSLSQTLTEHSRREIREPEAWKRRSLR